ncbi:MAG TPA: SprT-like family protein [Planctomycetaceae bacterium]|nr:SprT-like family protein [Planctomycetaceae bacterium]
MSPTLIEIIQSKNYDIIHSKAEVQEIHRHLIDSSNYVNAPNFTKIHPSDLELIFDEYDRRFFDGAIRASLGDSSLNFRLSKRMTSSGGSTRQWRDRYTRNQKFEITISAPILFESFDGPNHRDIIANGIVCHDRVEALQRIMEHEIIHLVEFLAFNESSCSRKRFHSLAKQFFGHTFHKHQLITPAETAKVKHGIMAGKKVRFEFEGEIFHGIVNRITKRATVLVESPEGQKYSDGRKYVKYYIPPAILEPLE